MTKTRYAKLVSSIYPHGLQYVNGLDQEIEPIVHILRAHGVETCQSCQGGPGHSYPVPTVDFLGDESAGWRALSVAIAFAMPIAELRRTWPVRNLSVGSPVWQMTFVGSKLPAFNSAWNK